MKCRRSLLLLLTASLAAMFVACGSSSSSSSSQQVTLSWSAAQYTPPSSMNAGAQQGLAVTITNGSANSVVNWTVTCSQASCGTFSAASTSSTVVTTYTAPASVPSGGLTVTVTATYSGTGTATPLSSNITINAAPVVSLAYTSGFAPPGSMTAGTTAGIAVTITNGSAGSVVNWTVTCGQASCGSFNPASTGSTAVTTYTAPASVPAGGLTVTVTATYSGTGTAAPLSSNITVNPATGISVSLGTVPTSMLIQGTANVVATVTNDSQNKGVNWSCTPTAACGSFNPTATASGATTVYTAPNIVPQSTSGAVTITATSVSNSSAYASATITITSNIGVTFSSGFTPPTSANINQQFEVAATVTGDPNNNGVNWTVTCGSAGACGSFSPTSTGSVVPTTYTAPAAIPTGNTVTITATSISDYTKTATSNAITITQPPPLLPNGTYVFQVAGEDTNNAPLSSPFTVAGAFTVNTNAITGGEEDFADPTFVRGEGILPTGGGSGTTMAATTDGNLQIILDTGDTTNIGAGTGLETLNVTLTSSSSGLITWFDGFATGTGTLTLQDPTAAGTTPLGGYALLSSGNEVTSSLGTSGGTPGIYNLGLGGIPVVASDGSISGFFDLNDSNAAVQTKVAFAGTSSVSPPDSFGRVQFTLDSTLPEIVLAGYIANASAISVVEIADAYGAYTGGGSITGGTALAQGSNAGNFNLSSLSGSSYAFATQGDDTQPFAQFAGALSFAPLNPSNLSVSGNATLNDIATQTSGAVSGTLSIDSSGRATIFTLSLGGVSGHIQLYLDGNGDALILTMHPSYVLAGPAFEQTASATVSGSYAMSGIGVSEATLNPWSAVGPVLNIASGTIGANSFTDFNYYGETLAASPCPGTGSTCAGVPLSGTLNTTTGTITGLGADSLIAGPSASDTFNVYPIDSAHAFAIETDDIQLGLLYLAPYTATPSAGTLKKATVKTKTLRSQTAK